MVAIPRINLVAADGTLADAVTSQSVIVRHETDTKPTEQPLIQAIWIEIVSKLAPSLIAAISATYVYLQYKRAQRWKASDLASALMERLTTDQALALACQALDWGVGPLIIPDRYRPLFGSECPDKPPAVMQHDPNVLCLAVEPTLNAATLDDPRGLVYRYCFDILFGYLDNIFSLLDDGQLRKEDIREIKYWLEQIRDYKYAPAKATGTRVFPAVLRRWGYGNIIVLAERLDVSPWPPPDAL